MDNLRVHFPHQGGASSNHPGECEADRKPPLAEELADQQDTDELLLELDQVLEPTPEENEETHLPTWADATLEHGSFFDLDLAAAPDFGVDEQVFEMEQGGTLEGVLSASGGDGDELVYGIETDAKVGALTVVADGSLTYTPNQGFVGTDSFTVIVSNSLGASDTLEILVDVTPSGSPVPFDADALEFDALDPDAGQFTCDGGRAYREPGDEAGLPINLNDLLASARHLAHAANACEVRSRQALYAAISLAYDFSIAAAAAPGELDRLLDEAGLVTQDRAPMTPIVKLVFGAEYDKTRLAEYATALSHARRLSLGRGSLADFLAAAPGGLKGVVASERAMRGAPDSLRGRDTPREAIVRRLRQMEQLSFEDISSQGNEFTLIVARRLPSGEIVMLGEVENDVPLLERASRKLLT